MLVVVVDTNSGETTLDATSANRLADLGVTHIAIARDDHTEAVVLEGWAFDTEASGAEATEIVAGTARHRTLRPVLQTLLSRGAGEALTVAAAVRQGLASPRGEHDQEQPSMRPRVTSNGRE